MATRKPGRSKGSRGKAPKARAARARKKAPAGARPARRAAPARRPELPRRSPETLRLRAITPGVTVNDLQRSLAFYTDVLGFMVKERWNDDNGRLNGVMLIAGVCELGLSQDDWAKGRDRTKGVGMRLWCETAQDLDAMAARLKAAGARLTEEPKDQPWGARSLSLDDPDGYHLTIFRNR
jgi:uncharacterized glyoxalase superfamily protein PhnB